MERVNFPFFSVPFFYLVCSWISWMNARLRSAVGKIRSFLCEFLVKNWITRLIFRDKLLHKVFLIYSFQFWCSSVSLENGQIRSKYLNTYFRGFSSAQNPVFNHLDRRECVDCVSCVEPLYSRTDEPPVPTPFPLFSASPRLGNFSSHRPTGCLTAFPVNSWAAETIRL